MKKLGGDKARVQCDTHNNSLIIPIVISQNLEPPQCF